MLTAEWEELKEVTDEESAVLQDAVFGGRAYISFDSLPLLSAYVTYDFAESAGFVEISEVTDGSVLNTAGLIGAPVNIKSDLSSFDATTITFHYDTALLTVKPDDLSIVWYDEENNRMVLLSKDVVIDTDTNTYGFHQTTSAFTALFLCLGGKKSSQSVLPLSGARMSITTLFSSLIAQAA